MTDIFFYSPNCEIKPGMSLPSGVRRYALVVEYSGADYQGFQRQASARRTVQGELERALSCIAAQPITLVCAGRTDAGVHATHQVVHFDCTAVRDDRAWLEGTNTQLPDSIRVRYAQQVPGEFHARFSAKARTYHYLTQIDRVRSAFLSANVTWTRLDLDVEAMQTAAQALVGKHDFTSFRASQCQAQSPVRKIEFVELSRRGAYVLMRIKANAFLHHMVRNVMGSLYEVGRGSQPVDWMEELLHARNRNRAAATAPPNGLYFVGVDYPPQFHLPSVDQGLGIFGMFGA
jgi:tRNA pseudouridine38-40 synthase